MVRDPNDPFDISRARAGLEAQLRRLQGTTGGNAAVFGATRIQSDIIRGELNRLNVDFLAAAERQRREVVTGVISAFDARDGESLDQRIAEELALRRRHNLLASPGAVSPGFLSVVGARF